jgi:hypothetical protein
METRADNEARHSNRRKKHRSSHSRAERAPAGETNPRSRADGAAEQITEGAPKQATAGGPHADGGARAADGAPDQEFMPRKSDQVHEKRETCRPSADHDPGGRAQELAVKSTGI